MSSKRAPATHTGLLGVLGRLRRDARGNALAFMAAMMIPLAGLAGSAVDMGRLYAVKSRLQQACDAGVLAGRKFMTDTTSSTLDSTATTQANTVFANNFRSGWFSTNSVSFLPSKTSENEVSATASANVPMVLMQLFGQTSKTVRTSCAARFDVADADIMFVLDTTGSMSCLTSDSVSTCNGYASSPGNLVQNGDGSFSIKEKSGSRIDGVRTAVLNFFDTVTSQADPTTNFRFGFVPYSATVNVGKLLQPMGYMATQWTYQSRVLVGDANSGSPQTGTDNSKSATTCTGSVRNPAMANTYATNGIAVVTTYTWSSGTCKTSAQNVVPNWQYKPVTYDTSGYISGSAVDNPAQPIMGTSRAQSTWGGCIEERNTTASTSFDTNHLPLDLDVDKAPTGSASSDNSYWRPLWPDVEFARASDNETTANARTVLARYEGSMVEGYAAVLNEVPCPLGASRLSSMQMQGGPGGPPNKTAIRSAIASYLSATNGFRPYGTTLHDIGITWGTRLLSPNGIFASDTAAWPNHNAPNRYIIFLTDGDMEADPVSDGQVYSAWGMERYDRRVCNGCTGNNANNYHNTRFTTACQIAKNHNIVIFVIAYAQTMTTQLQQCASPNQAYYASDTSALNTAFSKIAQQVAMLRLSR